MKTAKQVLGYQGEEAAIRHLVRSGYHLLERNWRMGHLEVDIIAEQYGTLVFVEVKSRKKANPSEALEAVAHTKQGNLIEAAREFLLLHGLDTPVRFDIIAVTGTDNTPQITHVRDAFSAESYARVERSRTLRA